MGDADKNFDFSGYATKAELRCSDGRIITAEAFKHQDKMRVPLVWQHGHSRIENILGHAILEARGDGVYTYCYFNDTPQGKMAKAMVQHGDLDKLSIYANQLKEAAKRVLHGMIREVSLVLSGANPGALIDQVRIQHSTDPEDVSVLDDEAIIHTGLLIEIPHANEEQDDEGDEVEHADGPTVKDVYESMTDQQRDVVHFMIAAALEDSGGAEHSDQDKDNEGNLEHKEGEEGEMSRNVFDQNDKGGTGTAQRPRHSLSHSDLKNIVDRGAKLGSLKAAFEEYAESHLQHGINDIDLLFPEARTLTSQPEFDKRRTEWVAGVLNGTRKSPFSRVKSIVADLTQAAARAKGYIKGEYKKEEWFGLTSRTTTPTTVYKKQRLDRDDIVDIVDLDVVLWVKGEMRLMLEEELARAILIGDGRDVEDEDKIADPMAASSGAGIRSIANENELYATTVYVNLGDASSSYTEVIEEVLRARKYYKGTGTPTLYTTDEVLTEMLLLKDTLGRRYYNNESELANALRVKDIVVVEVMEDEPDIVGIIVNLADYNVGADKGGEVNLFDDFDIDYNQYKYLIETRISGALTKVKSALVIRKTDSTNVLVHPVTEPTFVTSTGVATVPSQTGVVYKNADTNATLSSGAQSAIAAGATINITAVPATGYYFKTNAEDYWSFTRDSA